MLLRFFKIIILVWFFATPWQANAQTQEYAIKAQFIINILKMTEWQKVAKPSPVTFCTIGSDPFHNAFDSLLSRTGDVRLTIRRNIILSDVDGCNALFISDSEKNNLGRILRKVQGMSVITFGDMKGFVDQGGMVGFIEMDKRIRFETNLSTMQQENIRLSAKLLELSRRNLR